MAGPGEIARCARPGLINAHDHPERHSQPRLTAGVDGTPRLVARRRGRHVPKMHLQEPGVEVH